MSKINDDNIKTNGSIYFSGTYYVSYIEYEPKQWHLASVDWSTNMNTSVRYLLYLAKENGRVFVKPYKHFRKSEYETLFGVSPGKDINLDRVVEIISGNYRSCIF